MQETSANPVFVALLCAARCLVPLLIMLGITYLLKKFGLIAEPPQPPPEQQNGNNNHDSEGGLAHGKA
jgi:hypothetical protein